ncbi:MAG: CehA/McbA family metallohydrolase [Lentisphaeria bacterium]|nr:MAG: CehA/McbA family metallohydrolase [Lentisphaeria bacterium]
MTRRNGILSAGSAVDRRRSESPIPECRSAGSISPELRSAARRSPGRCGTRSPRASGPADLTRFPRRGARRCGRSRTGPNCGSGGWFKGDFHAHLVHGENIYRGNLPLFAFAARAEHYDWLWCSSRFANDGDITDYKRLAERLSDDRFLLRLNAEFPKNRRGHVGNLGVEPITLLTDTDGVTNFELARRYITSRGGVAIPVHPLYNDVIREENGRRYSWMTGKEVFLWLLCAPEMMPCLDLFYNADTPGASEFWYMLLNLGYRIGCCATSDSAFDVGRTPGDGRGATFVRMEALTEAALLQGLRERRTVTTWDGAVVLLEIDGHTSGDILAPDGARRRVLLSVYDRPGKRIDLKLIRNGLCVNSFSGTLPPPENSRSNWKSSSGSSAGIWPNCGRRGFRSGSARRLRRSISATGGSANPRCWPRPPVSAGSFWTG